MVARPRLLGRLLVLLELLLRRERGAVDALQLLVRFVALEVDARRLEQLDRADLRGALHVRAAAEVDEAAVAIERDRVAGRNVLQALELQVVAALAEDPLGLLARHLDALERRIFGDDLAHLRLDRLEILGREGAREAEVVLVLLGVILASGVVLRLGPEPGHRVGEHVLGRVADELARLGVLGGEQAERAALARAAGAGRPAGRRARRRSRPWRDADRSTRATSSGVVPARHAALGAVGKGQTISDSELMESSPVESRIGAGESPAAQRAVGVVEASDCEWASSLVGAPGLEPGTSTV